MSQKVFYLFICLFVYLFITPFPARAAGEFKSDYDVHYAIAPSGVATVTQNITLTNRLSQLFAKQFVIVVDSLKIKNVIAHDKRGIITPKITQKNGKTEIVVGFNDRVAGLGKQLEFTLRYDNESVAQKNGSIWEINIPGVANNQDLGDYTVTLDVPNSFGPNAYITPQPAKSRTWTKEQMIQGGISAAYGIKQGFDLSLSYHLENSSATGENQEIALPPDTAFQKVTIAAIDPLPEKVYRDKDGNWLAQYLVPSHQKIDISAKMYATISLQPRETFAREAIDTAQYLGETSYWNTHDPRIVSLASQYKSPKEIYLFVIGFLKYDYSRISESSVRFGAIGALDHPEKSLCMEFTDLFITIARAAGIPARKIVGYAYTTNAKLRPLSLVADVLHAWPEYYDAELGLWIPIDPTWANTTGGVNYFDKLDFNHIVLAIHGSQGDYPYPAGFYRKSGSSQKDVIVKFADIAAIPYDGTLTTSIDFPKIVFAGFGAKGGIVIENLTGISIDQSSVAISSYPYKFSVSKMQQHITPFSKISIPVDIEINDYYATQKGSITATVNDEITRTSFFVLPLYVVVFPAFALVGFLAWILYVVTKKHVLWRQSKKH